jgi:8-oxo-dGTP pyrophosphatase MutT (NUDIX family)
VIGVGVILADDTGAILLGHRTKPTEPATWCLPGGAVEAGETFESAAARELAEETGIHVDAADLEVRGVVLDDTGGAPRVSAAVRARVGPPVPGAWQARVTEPHIFSGWDWFAPDALPTPLFPASGHVLRLVYGTTPRVEPAPAAAYRTAGHTE